MTKNAYNTVSKISIPLSARIGPNLWLFWELFGNKIADNMSCRNRPQSVALKMASCLDMETMPSSKSFVIYFAYN